MCESICRESWTECDADSRIGIDNETGSHQRVTTIEVELDTVACKFSEIWAHLISEYGLVAIDTHDAVAYLHSCLGCRTVVRWQACHHHRITRRGKQGELLLVAQEHLSDGIWQCNLDQFAIALYHGLVAKKNGIVEIAVFGWHVIDRPEDIAIAETYRLCIFAIRHSVLKVTQLEHVTAPMPSHADVDDAGKDDIVEHTAKHYHKTRESSFGTELPRLNLLTEVIGTVCLIDHARDGTIASERNPAYAIFCVASLWLPSQKRELLSIEKKIKLLNLYLEDTGPHEMTQLMYENQNRQCSNELQGLENNNTHANNCNLFILNEFICLLTLVTKEAAPLP